MSDNENPPSDETVILSPRERARRAAAAEDATVILAHAPRAATDATPAGKLPIALPAGYRINEYEIERPLGGGGFGMRLV